MKKKAASLITLAVVLGLGCAIGASANAAVTSIKSAVYSPAKVYFYDHEIPLKDPLVLIAAENETTGRLYMPMGELLEYMNFQVAWDREDKAVYLTMNGYNGYSGYNGAADDLDSLPQNEADETALTIMQRTGNWSYIEPYLPYMSRKGINAVVASYNSKHMNPNEHKRASDYYN